jgi:molecular chaperone GrpE (heat shock protein)
MNGGDFAELVEEFAAANKSLGDLYDAQRRHNNAQADETAKLWQELAELRDELLAVANRVENLTRAVTTAPAEVAERMLRGDAA